MKSKVLSIMSLLVLCLMLASCGNNTATNNSEVEALKQQIADLQNQVNSNQNTQQNQNYQQTQPYQQPQTQPYQQPQTQPYQQQQSIPQAPAVPPQPYQPQMGGQMSTIDVETAKANAASHAGFNVANVTFVKQKYDFDDGIAKWEIDFVVNQTKYEYEVNATNGAIIKFEMESIYS